MRATTVAECMMLPVDGPSTPVPFAAKSGGGGGGRGGCEVVVLFFSFLAKGGGGGLLKHMSAYDACVSVFLGGLVFWFFC